MNMKENRSIWQYLEFPESCPAEHFSNINPNELAYYVKLKSYQHERCVEFQAVRLRVKNHPKQSPDAPENPQLRKSTKAVLGFRKLVMWLTQTLSIGDQFSQATNLETYGH
jgi:hypothetical protein